MIIFVVTVVADFVVIVLVIIVVVVYVVVVAAVVVIVVKKWLTTLGVAHTRDAVQSIRQATKRENINTNGSKLEDCKEAG